MRACLHKAQVGRLVGRTDVMRGLPRLPYMSLAMRILCVINPTAPMHKVATASILTSAALPHLLALCLCAQVDEDNLAACMEALKDKTDASNRENANEDGTENVAAQVAAAVFQQVFIPTTLDQV